MDNEKIKYVDLKVRVPGFKTPEGSESTAENATIEISIKPTFRRILRSVACVDESKITDDDGMPTRYRVPRTLSGSMSEWAKCQYFAVPVVDGNTQKLLISCDVRSVDDRAEVLISAVRDIVAYAQKAQRTERDYAVSAIVIKEKVRL